MHRSPDRAIAELLRDIPGHCSRSDEPESPGRGRRAQRGPALAVPLGAGAAGVPRLAAPRPGPRAPGAGPSLARRWPATWASSRRRSPIDRGGRSRNTRADSGSWPPGCPARRRPRDRPPRPASDRRSPRWLLSTSGSAGSVGRGLPRGSAHRYEAIAHLLQGGFDGWSGRSCDGRPAQDEARRWPCDGSGWPGRPRRGSSTHSARRPGASCPLQPCLRDARPEHFLFEGDRVSGLVNFGAMGVDCVAGDLARLIGEWLDGDPTARAEALAAYERIRPLDGRGGRSDRCLRVIGRPCSSESTGSDGNTSRDAGSTILRRSRRASPAAWTIWSGWSAA